MDKWKLGVFLLGSPDYGRANCMYDSSNSAKYINEMNDIVI